MLFINLMILSFVWMFVYKMVSAKDLDPNPHFLFAVAPLIITIVFGTLFML